MNFIINFLLIGGISIKIGEASSAKDVLNDIKHYFDKGAKDLGISGGHQLRLIEGKKLGETDNSIVWQGVYTDDIPVAVKIVWNEKSFKREVNILKALNATKDPNIEQFGIPRVYYYGPILKGYGAIAMTLLHGSLEEFYQNHNRKLRNVIILEIFKQTIKTLKYLNDMNVLHNDIKPDNIFFRDTQFFISDFDLATEKGRPLGGRTLRFASANYYNGNERFAMDDLESLAYTMWYISDVPLGQWTWWLFGVGIPEGFVLSRYTNKQDATDRVMQKLVTLENDIVREAFEYICVHEMLSSKPVPDYDSIITKLSESIDLITDDHSC